jgi:hypothetical protein
VPVIVIVFTLQSVSSGQGSVFKQQAGSLVAAIRAVLTRQTDSPSILGDEPKFVREKSQCTGSVTDITP